jgi:hypothetical protein
MNNLFQSRVPESMKAIPGRMVVTVEPPEVKVPASKPPKRELVTNDSRIKYRVYWEKNKDEINRKRREKYKAHPRFKHPDRAAQKAQYWREYWIKNRDRIMEKRRAAKIRK